jgi:hypothetical protein
MHNLLTMQLPVLSLNRAVFAPASARAPWSPEILSRSSLSGMTRDRVWMHDHVVVDVDKLDSSLKNTSPRRWLEQPSLP